MREFLRLLSNNSVYLPDALCSHVSQISLARHLMMIATTKIVSEKLSSLSLLEIGSWLGASTLAWSHGINRYFPNGGKILCVDPWNQYLDKVEIEQKVKTLKMVQRILRSCSEKKENIKTPRKIDRFQP